LQAQLLSHTQVDAPVQGQLAPQSQDMVDYFVPGWKKKNRVELCAFVGNVD